MTFILGLVERGIVMPTLGRRCKKWQMICREGTYKTCQTIYASLSVALALAAFAIHWTDSTFNHVYEICFSRAAQTELE